MSVVAFDGASNKAELLCSRPPRQYITSFAIADINVHRHRFGAKRRKKPKKKPGGIAYIKIYIAYIYLICYINNKVM